MISFITDLDRTIIFSLKSFKGKYEGERVCVEKNGDKEITYMTPNSTKLIQELLNKVNFIPCTMRSLSQTMRVDFIRENNIGTIICSNGAEIYIDGELDLEWHNKMREIVPLEGLLHTIDSLKDLLINEEVEVRNIRDFYVEVKCKDTASALSIGSSIKSSFENNTVAVLINTNKIFIIHRAINKGSAVRYLKEKLGLINVIASGDAEVDISLLKEGTYSLVPKHRTFHETFNYVTQRDTIEAGEEILKKVIKLIS